MEENRVTLYLGKKDDLLKSWFEQASINDINISGVVCGAVRHFCNTGEYMALGKVVKKNFPSQKKNISIADGTGMQEIAEKFREQGLKETTEIKRILLRGITESKSENIIVTEEEVYDILYGRNVVEKRPVERESQYNISHSSNEYNLEDTKKEKTIPNKVAKKKKENDFVLAILPEGCGLGQ